MHRMLVIFRSSLTGWLMLLLGLCPAWAVADDPEMDRQLQLINAQAEMIDQLARRVELLEARLQPRTETYDVAALPAATPEPTPVSRSPLSRDAIGDLNALVREGSIPQSIRLPGPRGISLRFGGFVKSLAYADSNQETESDYFLPALLGMLRPDEEGQYRHTADLSRLALEAVAPVGDDNVRAYVEYEFRNDFSLRHAYLQWNGQWGEVRAGQYWSALMDLQSLFEGVAEPTISGAIFARQTQFRYSTPSGNRWRWTLSLEDPSSNDLVSGESFFGRTDVPDLISSVTYSQPDVGHVQLGALARRLKVDSAAGSDTDFGWGVALSGHLDVGQRDKLIGMGVYGEGVGRYLLGITPTAGGAIDGNGGIVTRDNFGGYVAYQRTWNDRFRSNVGFGYAEADNVDGQPGDAFNNSTYAMVNLMHKLNEHITLGIEYNYGRRENLDGGDLDNHRIVFGLQAF